MSKKAFLLILALCLTGAGCGPRDVPKPQMPPMPVIDISEPGLNASTTESQTHLIGTSNMPAVYVGQDRYDVKDGKFDIVLDLNPGENRIDVSAGNGFVTSTLPIMITESATSTGTGIKDASSAITQPTKTTKVTAQVKPVAQAAKPSSAPEPAPVPVTFSPTEMNLSVLQTAYGAQLDWSRASQPFQSYLVIKSTTDPNLYFPKQFWTKAFNGIDTRTWTDRDVAAGKTTYYRICKLEPDQSAVCGNIAHITKQ